MLRPASSGLRAIWWLFAAGLAVTASANEVKLSSDSAYKMACAGIYSKQDWGGSHDAFIEVVFNPQKDTGKRADTDWISMVIFEYRNVDMIGTAVAGSINKKYICDEEAVAADLCKTDHIGTFLASHGANLTILTSDNARRDTNEYGEDIPPQYAEIATARIDPASPRAIRYPIKRSGYYCVSSFPGSPSLTYSGVAVYQNAFGQLAASQIPKLPFYGGAALAYLVVFALWMFSYVQHRSDILPVQNYVTAICGFLVLEMIVIWGYYDLVNSKGTSAGTMVYLAFVSILNSFRNAFTFFLLLIVCLGYGVVKPSLGNLMWKCRALAGAHFVSATIFTVASYIISPDYTGSPIVLLLVMPLGVTMTTFYVWILSSLTATIKLLEERKQHVKAQMYKNLWRILLLSIIIIFGFFFLNSLMYTGESVLEFVTNHWQSRWFLLDGWLNVVYFVDFCLIAFIWRPTANNRRFAMSTELAQDENDAQEFEIGSLRESLDEEQMAGPPDADGTSLGNFSTPPAYLGRVNNNDNDDDRPAAAKYFAPREKKSQPAEDVGETMFAVGDDDDDDEDLPTTSTSQPHAAPSNYDEWNEDEDEGDDDEDELILDSDEDDAALGEAQQLRKKKAA